MEIPVKGLVTLERKNGLGGREETKDMRDPCKEKLRAFFWRETLRF